MEGGILLLSPFSLGELLLEVEIDTPTQISVPLKPDMEQVHHIACPHMPSVRKKVGLYCQKWLILTSSCIFFPKEVQVGATGI